jgi:rfaE bifunctional protein nucleotidyltransferase chain/domain
MKSVPKEKIVALEALVCLRKEYQRRGLTVVWTNGCFDLLHVGHVRSLQMAASLGDVLVVGLNSDDSVRRVKGPNRPIFTEEDRAAMLAALDCVDHILLYDEATPTVCLGAIRPDIHCKGEEYAPPNGRPLPEGPVVMGYGGRIAYLPLLPGISTSDLIARLQKQEMQA